MYVTVASIKKKIVTIILVGMNVIVFLVVNVFLFNKTGIYWLHNLSQQNYLILEFGQYWRLISSMFIHADVFHLLSNMFFLGIFGLLVENKYSVIQYLAIYFISGLFGNLISLFVLPSNVFSLGASGCIFGVLGAYYVSFTAYDKRMIVYAIVSSLIMVGLSVGVEINSWAHLFGALGGLLFGWIFTRYNTKKDQNRFYVQRRKKKDSKDVDADYEDEFEDIDDY